VHQVAKSQFGHWSEHGIKRLVLSLASASEATSKSQCGHRSVQGVSGVRMVSAWGQLGSVNSCTWPKTDGSDQRSGLLGSARFSELVYLAEDGWFGPEVWIAGVS
jgi:hypothetical protein